MWIYRIASSNTDSVWPLSTEGWSLELPQTRQPLKIVLKWTAQHAAVLYQTAHAGPRVLAAGRLALTPGFDSIPDFAYDHFRLC